MRMTHLSHGSTMQRCPCAGMWDARQPGTLHCMASKEAAVIIWSGVMSIRKYILMSARFLSVALDQGLQPIGHHLACRMLKSPPVQSRNSLSPDQSKLRCAMHGQMSHAVAHRPQEECSCLTAATAASGRWQKCLR